MNQHFSLKPFYFVLSIVTVSSIIYLLSMFGLFNGYDVFFGKIHDHKWHSLFRMSFVFVIVVVNHWVLVPRLYGRKHYLSFFCFLIFCLVSLLILPDIVVTTPKFGHQNLVNGLPPSFPMRTLMFDLIHLFLFFFISIFISVTVRNRQNYAKITQFKPEIEQNQAVIIHNNAPKDTTPQYDLDSALLVTVNYSLIRLPFAEILFIKSMGNYLHFFLKDKKPVLVRMTLKEAFEKLPDERFLRVHKSYIVAVVYIENIRNKIIQINDQEIPIGRAYEEAVLKIFGK
jgi:LytTr DNA-binding domain